MTLPHRSAVPPLAVFLAALVVLALGMGAARAQTGQPYTVTVNVDVEGENAQAARQAALAQGQRLAMRRLLERLTLPADHSRLPQVDPSRIEQVVRSMEIANERSSDVRYIADLTVRFDPDGVRRILDGAGINYVDSASKPIVVLPVWRSPNGPVLWDDPNPWRQAWAQGVPQGGLLPVIVPLGGLDDLQQVDASRAVAAEPEALTAIGSRYGAGEVLVAVADPAAGTATLTRFNLHSGQDAPAGQHDLPGGQGPEAYVPVVEDIVRDLEARWKKANMVAVGAPQEIDVRAPLTAFDTWVQVRARLDQVNLIKSVEVRSLSRTQAMLRLSYLGDVPRLQTALRQRDLILTPDGFGSGSGLGGGQDWLLQIAGQGAPSRPAPGQPTPGQPAPGQPGSLNQPSGGDVPAPAPPE